MGLMQHYANPAPGFKPDAAPAHFDEVSSTAPPEMGKGLGDAFRSDSTPPFGQMVGQLFGRSNPQQRPQAISFRAEPPA